MKKSNISPHRKLPQPPLHILLSDVRKRIITLDNLSPKDGLSSFINTFELIIHPLTTPCQPNDYYHVYLSIQPAFNTYKKVLNTPNIDYSSLASQIMSLSDPIIRFYLFIPLALSPNFTTSPNYRALISLVHTITSPLLRLFALDHLYNYSLPFLPSNHKSTEENYTSEIDTNNNSIENPSINKTTISPTILPYLITSTTLSLQSLSQILQSNPSTPPTLLTALTHRTYRHITTLPLTISLFRSLLLQLQSTLHSCTTTTQEHFYVLLLQTTPSIPLHTCLPELLSTLTTPYYKIDLKFCLAPLLDKLSKHPPPRLDILPLLREKITTASTMNVVAPNDACLLLVSVLRTAMVWYSPSKLPTEITKILDSIHSIIVKVTPNIQFHITAALELIIKTLPLLVSLKIPAVKKLTEHLSTPNMRKIARFIVAKLHKEHCIVSFCDAENVLSYLFILLNPAPDDIDASSDFSLGLSVFSRFNLDTPKLLMLVDTHLQNHLNHLNVGSLKIDHNNPRCISATLTAAQIELKLAHSSDYSTLSLLFSRILLRVSTIEFSSPTLAVTISMEAALIGKITKFPHALYFFEKAMSVCEHVTDEFIRADCIQRIIENCISLPKSNELTSIIKSVSKAALSIHNRPRRCKVVLLSLHLWPTQSDDIIKKYVKVVLKSASECEQECAETIRIDIVNHLIWCYLSKSSTDISLILHTFTVAEDNFQAIFSSQMLRYLENTRSTLQRLGILS
ncbi:Vacuolar protein sorting-associated protein 35 [Entamoeba marina]